jgi:serine/threonine protein kinase/tetratricopeptide (TPR) repeat protein
MLGKTISHYKIIEKVGEGGMGVVYKAQDIKLDRIVALKFLPKHLLCEDEARTRFEYEAKAASALNHPNITTIHEIDEAEGECFICMEYIEGKSLKELIKEKELSIQAILRIAIQICEGLNAAHKKQIIHRDIKSDNLKFTPDGLVKIMDFGLAKLKGVSQLTKTGTTLGTVQYMPPEQAQGMQVDERSDIFSFGVVLYEMITEHLPFTGEHEAAVIYSIVNETPEPLARYKANVPEGLQRIVDKALQKDPSIRYQSAADIIADLKGMQKERTTVVARPRKKLFRFIIPASIVFIILLLFLILKPFKVEVVGDKRAIAKENSLAIMYFENMVDREDKERLGEIVTNLLITDLSESEYMSVVSSQRLYDILKLLGKEGEKKIDREVATQVATKAGVKWMLLGNILQVKPQTVITTQLVNVESGQVEASQRITGEAKEQIFSLADKLTIEIKKDLSLPAVAQQEPDPSVADVTTHSPEAYRYYLEGLDNYNKHYHSEAEKSFRKALEFDSTFAMAYYRLGDLGGGPEQKELIAKAVEYLDKVSWKENHYIKSLEARTTGNYAQAIVEAEKIVERYPKEKEAFYWLGRIYYGLRQFEESIRYWNQAIEIDPLYKTVYNDLSYAYHKIGDFEKSIWAMNKYISLAPDEANPYDTRGDLYAWNGKLDQAIQSYKKALEIKPDFYLSLAKLGDMYLFKREYATAESCYKELSSGSGKDLRSYGRTGLALIPLYQGKLEEALKVLNDGIAADRMEQAEEKPNVIKHLLKASIYEQKKNLNLALKEAKIGREIYERAHPDDPVGWREFYTHLLAESGKISEAEEVARTLKKGIEEKNPGLMYGYWLALGIIEQAKGNIKTAVTYWEKAAKEAPSPLFNVRFSLATAYLKLGRLGEAVSELEKALSRYDNIRAILAIWAVKAHYLLALAYEKSGWNKKAIEKYEEFLDIWKDADPGIPEVQDAKERLKKLRAES